MTAKIEIYNDKGDLISKYEAPSYKKHIDYEDGYEVHKYFFNFMYAEYEPKWQGRSDKE